jgi:hypothetical protein
MIFKDRSTVDNYGNRSTVDKYGNRDELRAEQSIADRYVDLDVLEDLDEDQSASVVGGIIGGVEAKPHSWPWLVSWWPYS